MRTILDSIPHESHRYSTVGDWYYVKEHFCCGWSRIAPAGSPIILTCPSCTQEMKVRDVLIINSSKLSDPRREFLIQAHELVEVKLCEKAGITQEVVDNFDKDFEDHRHPDNDEEPGDSPSAPYVRQHCIATGIERLLAAELGVNWQEYEAELSALPEVKPK